MFHRIDASTRDVAELHAYTWAKLPVDVIEIPMPRSITSDDTSDLQLPVASLNSQPCVAALAYARGHARVMCARRR